MKWITCSEGPREPCDRVCAGKHEGGYCALEYCNGRWYLVDHNGELILIQDYKLQDYFWLMEEPCHL